MLTGSEDPSNQLASLSTAPVGLFFVTGSSDETALSPTEILSGDTDRMLGGRMKGKKAEDLVGEGVWVRANSGGSSAAVRDR
jgi:hypothetical protein